MYGRADRMLTVRKRMDQTEGASGESGGLFSDSAKALLSTHPVNSSRIENIEHRVRMCEWHDSH